MSHAEVAHGAADQRSQERRPPGVYRAVTDAHTTGSSSSATAATTAAAAGTSSVHENQVLSSNVDPSAADARHRFYQLRALRREMCGRPFMLDSGGHNSEQLLSAPSAMSTSPPLIHLRPTSLPAPTSYGLPLDRLPIEDSATRYILRTAAAERALRHQQADNDSLKRLVLTHRQEADDLRQQLERLSLELAASSQTVLRQTATMRSLTSEMERHDAYHLIKERRASSADTLPPSSTGEQSAAGVKGSQRTEALAAEVAQLRREKDVVEEQLHLLTQQQQQEQKRKSKGGPRDTSAAAIEAIERDEDELAAEDEERRGTSHEAHTSWFPFAAEELERLVQTFGRVLSGAAPRSYTRSASPPFLSSLFSCDVDLVMEVTLSDLSFTATSSVGRQLGHNRNATSSSHDNHGVLSVCGPYDRSHLLLSVHLANPHVLSVPPVHRRPRSQEPLSTRCCFYALPDTQGVLTFGFFETAEDETKSPASGAAGDAATPTATATVPVRSLIAAATTTSCSEQGVGRGNSGVSTVHTIHLHTDGYSASCGAATLVACVTAVQRTATPDRVYHSRQNAWNTERADDNVRGGPLSSSTVQATVPGAMAEAAAAAERSTHRHQRAPLMSPSREDGAAGSTRRRLTPLSSSMSSTRTTPPSHQALPLVAEGTPRRSSSPAVPSSVAALEKVKNGETTKAENDEGVKANDAGKLSQLKGAALNAKSTPDDDSSSEAAQPLKGEEAQPSHPLRAPPATTVPLPPLVRVPTPPAITVPSAPPAKIRIYVKSLRDFHSSTSEEVEDLLEHCAVQVGVYLGPTQVLAAPPRRNPSHAVWGAEDGTCSTAVSVEQDIRFEVRDGSTAAAAHALAQAVVRVSDVLGNWGERDLAVMSVTDSAVCGTLTVCFSSLDEKEC
ncbi:hypothetical protein ABB37_04999 [Leptomonas pyrrhocoris]|uniref:Uncharacterized protein n=1 Tax=Leptomonas pyrrhocoris TaxID=157538 RepID=A0A0N0VF31_LEPPY|nr:hypothetical protein ABB37_04999 [Leptomonas pyrrhocoris]KPA79952.1 hypothetical protein ABB37_04999 [Leptomonas pyrrhocoris]|eukprot:XP_015658391.1 hypothetical protein ABB37_04999 [Leptomonas pyrrhocoris]